MKTLTHFLVAFLLLKSGILFVLDSLHKIFSSLEAHRKLFFVPGVLILHGDLAGCSSILIHCMGAFRGTLIWVFTFFCYWKTLRYLIFISHFLYFLFLESILFWWRHSWTRSLTFNIFFFYFLLTLTLYALISRTFLST